MKNIWTSEETETLRKMRNQGATFVQISKVVGKPHNACRFKWNRMLDKPRVSIVPKSMYPQYNTPLVAQGNAIIMSDVEAPFHHSDFINKCLELANSWKIQTLILNGDFLHFDSISSWEANWTEQQKLGLSEEQERIMVDFIKRLPEHYQEEGFSLLTEIDGGELASPNFSTEMQAVRDVVGAFTRQFKDIYVVLGNHEGRLLRAMQTPLFPTDLLQLINANEQWHVAPYYYMKLVSGENEYLIEHPKNSTRTTASWLAMKYLTNVIVGHSHLVEHVYDRSGKYHAITSGCCVDEDRLPYASQRHNASQAHALGAVIVRNGVPWLLTEKVDWEALNKIV